MKKDIALTGLLHAVIAVAYIALVAFVINHGDAWFGKTDTPLTGMAAVMLFVLSAGVMIALAFLRPVFWYLEGKKKEAFQLILWMISFFFIFTVIVFVIMALIW